MRGRSAPRACYVILHRGCGRSAPHRLRKRASLWYTIPANTCSNVGVYAMPIRVLDSRVAAQIAAGEVVERPASIVKELVENALDAGAARISVSIRGGGIDEIVIQDDGGGIPADEIELAFNRHATSKLTSADDLWAIQTLGFRGEALPAIAAIAQVSCVSRVADAPIGAELRIAGGEVQSHTARGCSPGTTF